MSRKRIATGGSFAGLQTGLLAAALVVVPAALWTTADPVGVVKWTLLIVTVIVLGAVLVLAHLERGATEIHLPTPGVASIGAFLFAVIAISAMSDSTWLALLGEYTFYQGTFTFLGLGIVLFTVVTVTKEPVPTILRATTVGAGLVAALTAGQFVGIDWFGYEARMFGRVVTTLGNSNFGAAFLALSLPAILHQVFFGSRSDVERWLSAAVAVVVAVEAVVIGSVQGPITAVVAVGAWLTFVGLAKVGLRRTVLGLGGFTIVASALVLAFWSRVHAEVSDSIQIGRQGAWLSGWEQFKDHPFLGVGLDHFGENYTAYRPAFSAARESERFTDAGQAHNVILDLLADGGLLLGGTYVILVIYTAYRGVRGLRRLHRDGDQARYLQLAAIFSLWVGYQIQAQVSIDHVPLALLHWVAMGAILRLAHVAEASAPLVLGTLRRRPTLDVAPLVGAVGAGLVLLWFALIPIRADLAAGATERLEQAGRPQDAIEKLDHAASLMPFRPLYWTQLGLRVQTVDGAVAAAPYIERGARLDRSNARIATLMAEYYVAVDDDESAATWYEEALERDPYNPEILLAAAAFHEARGDREGAAELRHRLAALPPPPE